MRDIILYGPMRAKFGRSFRMDVRSVGEAFKALAAVVPGFRKWFNEQSRNGAQYKILIGQRSIATGEVNLESTSEKPIRIVPVVAGSKNSKLLGAALAIGGLFLLPITGPLSFSLALGMAIGGVGLLMVPTPKTASSESTKKDGSTGFDGPVNSTTPGGCLPVLYGVMEVGSVVASAAIYTEDVSNLIGSAPGWVPVDTYYPSRDPYETYTQWNP